jgi:hypothetical protein
LYGVFDELNTLVYRDDKRYISFCLGNDYNTYETRSADGGAYGKGDKNVIRVWSMMVVYYIFVDRSPYCRIVYSILVKGGDGDA